MIKFILVQGDVHVDEKDLNGKEMGSFKATPGMALPLKGRNLVIAAGTASRATLTINGQPAELKHDSFIHIKPDGRSFLQRHKEQLGKESKLFFGRIWAKAMEHFGTEREEITGSGGGGIRG